MLERAAPSTRAACPPSCYAFGVPDEEAAMARLARAARPPPSLPTSTMSPGTRQACGGIGFGPGDGLDGISTRLTLLDFLL